jgi:hypothetical protein
VSARATATAKAMNDLKLLYFPQIVARPVIGNKPSISQ